MSEHLKSWSCKGCTNYCYRVFNGVTYKYCIPALEGRSKYEWVTDTFIDCLNKTTDPNVTDETVRLHPSYMRGDDK